MQSLAQCSIISTKTPEASNRVTSNTRETNGQFDPIARISFLCYNSHSNRRKTLNVTFNWYHIFESLAWC